MFHLPLLCILHSSLLWGWFITGATQAAKCYCSPNERHWVLSRQVYSQTLSIVNWRESAIPSHPILISMFWVCCSANWFFNFFVNISLRLCNSFLHPIEMLWQETIALKLEARRCLCDIADGWAMAAVWGRDRFPPRHLISIHSLFLTRSGQTAVCTCHLWRMSAVS